MKEVSLRDEGNGRVVGSWTDAGCTPKHNISNDTEHLFYKNVEHRFLVQFCRLYSQVL